MTAAFRTMTFVIASIVSLFAFQPARADHGGLDRIDRLASSIQSESRTLYYELRGAGSVQNEVAQIYELASRIHDGAHGYASRRQMDRDVHALKRLVHHVEEHLIGYRHLHRHIDRIDQRTHDLEDAIHSWDDDYFHSRPVVVDPWYGSRPGVSLGSGGVTIGSRGFSFSIGR